MVRVLLITIILKKASRILSLSLLGALISGCSLRKEAPSLEHQQAIEAANNYVDEECPLVKMVNIKKDVILATLYYPLQAYTLKSADKQVLDKVLKLINQCQQHLMLLGFASNYEARQLGAIEAAQLSRLRMENVRSYLQAHLSKGVLYSAYCSNSKNKFIEENASASLPSRGSGQPQGESSASSGNQRVEIIMTSRTINDEAAACFPE